MSGTKPRTKSTDARDRAVEAALKAVETTPKDHPDRVYVLNELGNKLDDRFHRYGSIEDLNLAIKISDEAFEASQGHPDQLRCLNNLGNRLGRRFEKDGSTDDLDRAIKMIDMAIEATPQDCPDRAARLSNLAAWLGYRYEKMKSIDDLDRAIKLSQMAVETSRGQPGHASSLSGLGIWLGSRYKKTGCMDDLDRAIEAANTAVEDVSEDWYQQASRFHTLANLLRDRSDRTGSMDDLNHAIKMADKSVEITPTDHASQPRNLSNLGICLGRRFERLGSMDDINRAVEVTETCVRATRPGYLYQAGRLHNLGTWLGRRSEKTGSLDDLNRAIEAFDMAVEASPKGVPGQSSGHLSNLGIWLATRFEKTGKIDDLRRAVQASNTAVDNTANDSPNRGRRLHNLGNRLSSLFEHTGDENDLDRAIKVAERAVEATPEGHPDRCRHLSSLGTSLLSKYERSQSVAHLNSALQCFQRGWDCGVSPPSERITSARGAASILADTSRWEEASSILEGAVKLLSLVSPRVLADNDKQHMLEQFAGLASMTVATYLEAGKDEGQALELLELGRCVIAGLLLEVRADISDLDRDHPALAAKFKSLRDELDSPPSKVTAEYLPRSLVDQRFQTDEELTELIAEIRGQPGFQDFLLPPDCNELRATADQGPIVVINVSLYRCDAFLIQRHRISLLKLPNLQEDELKTRLMSPVGSATTLEWLWNVAARPILEELGYKHPPRDDNWPHVWWILTGALSHFPIHAAGRHYPGSTETVLDRVMSSYVSSVKALVYGRRHGLKSPTRPGSDHALLVSMQETEGYSALPFAIDEVAIVTKLCPLLQLKVITPARRREEVLAHLRSSKVFHFAGHGYSDPGDPSRSRLLLDDWNDKPLTVADIRDHNIAESSPFLAYLSACSTSAQNKAGKLIDEGIHLTSGFHLAGFRHVIGTLWTVSDSHCVDVARAVYENIGSEGMTDGAVCRGLHQAIRALRREVTENRREKLAKLDQKRDGNLLYVSDKSLQCWAPYIHFGA